MKTANIREIFLSIQGEGPYIGEQQLFIRFCGCNLKCEYCDTDFNITKSKIYTTESLLSEIKKHGEKLVLSLTGGEPLVSVDFLEEFLPPAKTAGHTIYLETNGTLPENLSKIINYIDIVSADIKIESATKQNISFSTIDKFFSVASQKETFIKTVFDSNITDKEITEVIEIATKYNLPIILQPKMNNNSFCDTTCDIENIFRKFVKQYNNIRLIPQMHKFLNVR